MENRTNIRDKNIKKDASLPDDQFNINCSIAESYKVPDELLTDVAYSNASNSCEIRYTMSKKKGLHPPIIHRDT